jgi:hypothetical protein
MSRWINKDLFSKFQEEKIEEKEAPKTGFNTSELLWKNPEKGTVEVPKVYEGRFLQDPKGEFYKKYYFHMWKSGEKWIFVLCTKTHDFKNYCPFCSANNKLYNGTSEDKKQAYQIKRKERFVGNWYVTKDPRDEGKEEENKVTGKVKLYEFPGKIEQKVKKEITDRKRGYGHQIFDPSKDGRDMIIEVLATKKDDKGEQYPDYSNSAFSREQYALGTDDEIEALMNSCTDLNEYIKSKELDKDKVVEILKNEFLWDIVEQECKEKGYVDVESSGKSTVKKENVKEEKKVEEKEDVKEEEVSDVKEETDNIDSNDSSDDISDDALLAELDGLFDDK